MRRRTVLWICLFGAVLLFSVLGCQPDKQKAVEPEKDAIPARKAAGSKTEAKSTVASKTPEQRLTELRQKARAKSIRRREGGGHLITDKTVYDFVQVESNTKLRATFTLSNDGKGPLRIRDVKSSCSCLVSKLSTRILAPGQSVPLTATFTSPKSPGKVTKTVSIMTFSSFRPGTLVLKVTATVKKHIQVKPARLELKQRDQAPLVLLEIQSTDNKPFQITGYIVSNKALLLDYDNQQSTTKHILTVKLNPVLHNTSITTGVISLKLNHPVIKSVSVPYRVIPPFAAQPSICRFAALEPGQSARASLAIVSNYGESFTLGDIKSEQGTVRVVNTTKTDSGDYKIQLEMAVPKGPKNSLPRDYLILEIKEDPDARLRILCYCLPKSSH